MSSIRCFYIVLIRMDGGYTKHRMWEIGVHALHPTLNTVILVKYTSNLVTQVNVEVLNNLIKTAFSPNLN